MEFLEDPEEMTPEGRLAEVAAILAVGYLRLRQSRPFTENPLDCSGAPVPLCVQGLTGGDPTPAEVQA